MESLISYLIFITLAFSMALEPGPGFIKLSIETSEQDKLAGLIAATGMFLGAWPHILIISIGINWLTEMQPAILSTLKIASGIYLIWLAYGLLTRKQVIFQEDTPYKSGKKERLQSLLSGFLLVFLNPRTPLLYSAFLPLFVDQNSELFIQSQLLILGATLCMVFLIVDCGYVIVYKNISTRFSNNSFVRKIAQIFGAAALLLLGIKLLVNDK